MAVKKAIKQDDGKNDQKKVNIAFGVIMLVIAAVLAWSSRDAILRWVNPPQEQQAASDARINALTEKVNEFIAALTPKAPTAPAEQAGGYGQGGPTNGQTAPPAGHDNSGFTFSVTRGGNGHPISSVHTSEDAQTACPGGRVKLEPAKRNAGGVPMTAEQRMRGDKRWHVVCDRS